MPAVRRCDDLWLRHTAALRCDRAGRGVILGLGCADAVGACPSAFAHQLPCAGTGAGHAVASPDRVLVKFNSFWTIELEPGWSLFATHPVDREDLPFRLVTGLVDADRFSDVGILFPAVWTDPAFTGTLPRGTPVAQCFAVPRDVPEMVFEAFSAEAAGNDSKPRPLLWCPNILCGAYSIGWGFYYERNEVSRVDSLYPIENQDASSLQVSWLRAIHQ